LVLHFSGRFLLIVSLRVRRLSMYVSLFSGIIKLEQYQRFPVNYTSEFWELSEATAYNEQHTKAIRTSNTMAH